MKNQTFLRLTGLGLCMLVLAALPSERSKTVRAFRKKTDPDHFLPRQQNLWASSGSGSEPRL
jgi:hypothetical protein